LKYLPLKLHTCTSGEEDVDPSDLDDPDKPGTFARE